MLGRLVALVILAAFVGGGLYLWKTQGAGGPAGSLGELGGQIQDTAITAAVRTAFGLDRELKPYAVAVSTENGVVTLRGTLPTPELRGALERVAGAVPDVRQVVNQLRVGGPRAAQPDRGRSLGERLDDEGIEVQVRLAFSLNRQLKDLPIEVQAFRRDVRLAGSVPSAALERLALETAARVPGVSSVTDALALPGQAVPERQDERLAAIARAFRSNQHLAAYALQAAVRGDRIVIHGRVATGAERDLAGLLARDAARQPVENAVEIRP
ncbi:MAG: BON domain-containing protein [Vicinamibacteria bacterium]